MDHERLIEATKPHRFKPGQSGNPKGRPKRRSLAEILRDELAKREGPNGETNGEYLIHRLVQRAIHGEMRAAQLVLEYAEGKPEAPTRIVEERIRAIAQAEGIEYRVLRERTYTYAERLA